MCRGGLDEAGLLWDLLGLIVVRAAEVVGSIVIAGDCRARVVAWVAALALLVSLILIQRGLVEVCELHGRGSRGGHGCVAGAEVSLVFIDDQ